MHSMYTYNAVLHKQGDGQRSSAAQHSSITFFHFISFSFSFFKHLNILNSLHPRMHLSIQSHNDSAVEAPFLNYLLTDWLIAINPIGAQ